MSGSVGTVLLLPLCKVSPKRSIGLFSCDALQQLHLDKGNLVDEWFYLHRIIYIPLKTRLMPAFLGELQLIGNVPSKFRPTMIEDWTRLHSYLPIVHPVPQVGLIFISIWFLKRMALIVCFYKWTEFCYDKKRNRKGDRYHYR
ncbi:MAG: hypothetical protein K6T88_18945 [Bacillus sp. (in: Bacteria)]|nr:hypothetical protein [Bacillus sp. (in: firmicutes)]